MTTDSPTCPSCGALLPPSGGTPLVTCPACGAALPKLALRKENKTLLIIGLLLSLLGFVGLTTSAAAFIDDTPGLILFLALCFPPGVVGIILLGLGFRGKSSQEEALAAFAEHQRAKAAWLEEQTPGEVDWLVAQDQSDQYWDMQQVQALASSGRRRKRLRIWGMVLAAISVEALILSILILSGTGREVLMMILPLTLVPAMVGLFLIVLSIAIKRRDAKNIESLRDYDVHRTAGQGL